MHKEPFFSIIIPTYNREEYISTAIQSIKNQSFKNWELIIIDDGSTDNTQGIVQEYLSDSRVRYFYQKNQERSASRNNGIKHSNGNWICFLDSDDYYHETHLQRFKDLIDKNKSKPGLYLCGFSINQYCQDKMEYNHSSRNNLEFVLINS